MSFGIITISSENFKCSLLACLVAIVLFFVHPKNVLDSSFIFYLVTHIIGIICGRISIQYTQIC